MTRKTATARHGFTLIELCCVVGIIAILSSIGSASYDVYVRRAQAAEAAVNVETIAYLEQVQILEMGAPLACAAEPAQIPTRARPAMFNSTPCWRELGFRPGARVRFQYATEKTGPKRFIARARGDLDEDGVPSTYAIDSATMIMTRENAD